MLKHSEFEELVPGNQSLSGRKALSVFSLKKKSIFLCLRESCFFPLGKGDPELGGGEVRLAGKSFITIIM